MAVLILGGTSEARALAAALDADGIAVTTSLAGVGAGSTALPGQTRVGGFGGPTGLAAWIGAQRVAAVIDATHPFASRISASAVHACTETSTPLLRLERPPWRERDGDRWHRVGNLGQAATAIPALGSRVLLTTGRGDLAAFSGIDGAWFLIRCLSPPDPPLPARHELLIDRGPFTIEGELSLIDRHRIDLVVTKDSGGDQVIAKLVAARIRELPVIVVDRPPAQHSATVHSVAQARAWTSTLLTGR